MSTQVRTANQPRDYDELSALVPLYTEPRAKRLLHRREDRRRGQIAWAVEQLLFIAKAEQAAGRRVDFVMFGADEPNEVLAVLCPEWKVAEHACTSEMGNQQVTQLLGEVTWPQGNTLTLDFTEAVYEAADLDKLDRHLVLDVEDMGVEMVARLVATETINGRLLATYETEGTVIL